MTDVRVMQRDLAVIGEVLRWGALPLSQLAIWFFDAERTAANRVTRLKQAGYLASVREGRHLVVTATRAGARLRSDLDVPWRERPWQSIEHLLATVQVAAALMAEDKRAGWITERELLNDQLKQARAAGGRLLVGLGRRPDGVLVRDSGEWLAIEVELHRKPMLMYERIMSWYLSQAPGTYKEVRWYVRGRALETRLETVVNRFALHDVVSVRQLPNGRGS
jgi:hypothetical protein